MESASTRQEKEYLAVRNGYEADVITAPHMIKLWGIKNSVLNRMGKLFQNYYEDSYGEKLENLTHADISMYKSYLLNLQDEDICFWKALSKIQDMHEERVQKLWRYQQIKPPQTLQKALSVFCNMNLSGLFFR